MLKNKCTDTKLQGVETKFWTYADSDVHINI